MARQRVYKVRLRAGQAGADGGVQGGVVAVGQEGQAGHGQVLVSFGDGECDRLFGQRSVRVMISTIATPAAATTPELRVCG